MLEIKTTEVLSGCFSFCTSFSSASWLPAELQTVIFKLAGKKAPPTPPQINVGMEILAGSVFSANQISLV